MATTNEKGGNPEKKSLTIRSSDGEEFVISVSAAVLSTTLKKAMEEDGVFPLSNVDSETLAMVVAYLNAHADEKRNFDSEFVTGKKFEVLNRLCLVGYSLEIRGLVDIVAQRMVDIMKTKSVSWIRRALGKEDDLSPEDKAEIRRLNCFVDWDADDERERAENDNPNDD